MKKFIYTNSKRIKLFLTLITLLSVFTSCEKDEELEQLEASNLKAPNVTFDFNQFGITHNEYLAFVWDIKDRNNPEARFKQGLNFKDATFGSFNKGQKFEDIDIEFHKNRVNSILEGTYNAKQERLSLPMTEFLQNLASTTKKAVDNQITVREFKKLLSETEQQIYKTQNIEIDLRKGISNDGATMLAITSILKYSTDYWISFENDGSGNGDNTPMAKGKIKRALADAWGYVSAWTNNGDGSYSWDHGSALVNADCVSDSVREN